MRHPADSSRSELRARGATSALLDHLRLGPVCGERPRILWFTAIATSTEYMVEEATLPNDEQNDRADQPGGQAEALRCALVAQGRRSLQHERDHAREGER